METAHLSAGSVVSRGCGGAGLKGSGMVQLHSQLNCSGIHLKGHGSKGFS